MFDLRRGLTADLAAVAGNRRDWGGKVLKRDRSGDPPGSRKVDLAASYLVALDRKSFLKELSRRKLKRRQRTRSERSAGVAPSVWLEAWACAILRFAMPPTDPEITSLLEAWSAGDPSALDQLVPLVFDDLHRMARYFFQRESKTHTLQPTALVSEVYFRMRGQKEVHLETRADFFNFAAEVMRHFLVDYARKRSAEKRGGGVTPLPFDSGIASLLSSTPATTRLLDLHRALEELEQIAPQQAQVVTLRFFLGLQVTEVAELLDISESTVKREWRTAKLWLRRELRSLAEDSAAGKIP